MLETTLTQPAKPAYCSKSLPQESEDEQKPVETVLRMPTQDELPCDDGVPMESQRHRLQIQLLIDSLQPWLAQQGSGYVGGNMFLYFSRQLFENPNFKGPNFFVVLGVPQVERKSWVVWQEEGSPDIVIELLSESTAAIDKGEKKTIYQDNLKVWEYYWFDPFNPEDFVGWKTNEKWVYQKKAFDAQNRLISGQLGLALVRWEGVFNGVKAIWLRWETLEGELLPTPEEYERQRAERLAAKLRALGINPDELG
ncbi:MAG TPA: Uma2 family endonuclease [Thiotrichaceae bacterium]|nr:Uma2 family endonuclease [Thiotrichaceae bacterium]